MKTASTAWAEATTSTSGAMISLVSCLESGKNAWLEVQKNGEQAFPVKVKNPALDDPFNWTMMYGTPRSEKELAEKRYFNDTEKDLTYNWTAAFSNKDAAETYKTTGKAVKGLLHGMGICTPVRIKDAEALRADGYKYEFWVTMWKPKGGIPYQINADIEKVFVVCFDEKPVDMSRGLKKAGEFLISLSKNS